MTIRIIKQLLTWENMAFLLRFSLLYSLLSFMSTTTTNAELIDSLPGQPGNVSFKQYSGYIVTDEHHGRALFYYFAEAQSKNKHSSPLTLWLGGAHGCVSAGLSVFVENGPFRVYKHGKLIKNEFSWNLESNMLYVEAPAGVGFSYSNTSSDYEISNDITAAKDNLRFLLKWFEKFPQYRNKDFYLAGDSYGGHYAPQLATLILEHNANPHVKPIKLKAISLGSPFLDISVSMPFMEYLWHRGILSEDILSLQTTLCNVSTYYTQLALGKVTENCKKMMKVSLHGLGEVRLEDILSPSCVSSTESLGEYLARGRTSLDACYDEWLVSYLNRPEVQKALHVNTTGLPWTWEMYCAGPINSCLDNYARNMMPIVSELMKKNIRIMIYSGDQGMMLPVTGARKAAYMLAKDLKLDTVQSNGAWYTGAQIGGWSTTFGRLKNGKKIINLTYATVRGGGTFVSLTSPSEALTLFKAFLRGSPPPTTSS